MGSAKLSRNGRIRDDEMRNEGKREINGKSLNGMIAMDWAFNANGRKTDGSKHEM